MKHYNVKVLERTKPGYTDLFILSFADGDFVLNATTDKVLTALAVGDVVDKIMTEVKTAVAGPTATLSTGVTSTPTMFTPATDVATGTATPYVAGRGAGTGFIASTSGGSPTTALTNATSGISQVIQHRAAILTATNLIAETILSNVAVTAGEVWIWASIDRAADRVIQVN